ncbi:GNAT family N-acetyltransferase [Ahniella affigens]|uniref:GNAT family N-acetyltransferase n=1 Tax=Ahniella affigens TaxID=2021234 RepID=A0A2P1PQE3_9GAMM|nr:GNAT family N-acetyltransferase [Ahniella affigens]AVP97038.1 GNAT family N-acetyltransferase [Ahniella affigens]
MSPRTFQLRDADYQADFPALQSIREPVFITEQQFPLAEEWDALDPLSRHVLAIDADGKPIATGRLTPEHKIGRMAVLPAWRGAGVGLAIVQRLIDIARELGYESVSLHSQMHAIPFYQRAGFVAEGEPFDECGAPHQNMRLPLKAANLPGKVLQVDRAASVRAAAIEIAKSARHGLCLASRELEFELYDDETFIEALKAVALSGRGALVRLLIDDVRLALERDHRLIQLAQRLSSKIEVRRPNPEYAGNDRPALLLNDQGGWLKRQDPSRYDGEYALNDRPRLRELQLAFDRLWERAEPETRIRALKM